MRSRGDDVAAFLKGVKELEDRVEREDQERLHRIGSKTKPKLEESEEDRFSRLRAREDELQRERAVEKKALSISDRTKHDKEPPKLPKRPDQPEKPSGFVASALRHAEPKPKPHQDGKAAIQPTSNPKLASDKPTWITSALQKSKPAAQKPGSSGTSSPKPAKPDEGPYRSNPQTTVAIAQAHLAESRAKAEAKRSETPPVSLKPQHAGYDPKFSMQHHQKDQTQASRTPSQTFKDVRSELKSKPKPTLAPKPTEDPIKEFRKELVLETSQPGTPVKKAKPTLEKRAASIPEAFKRAQALKPAEKGEKQVPPSPEAFEKLQALKPAERAQKQAPPSPEAFEKLQTLRKPKPSPRKVSGPPEALERMKSLNKAPKLPPRQEPKTDAAAKLETLRPSTPVQGEAPPSPEAVERLQSLRRTRPKPQAKEPQPEALQKRAALKARKPSLGPKHASSETDFRTKLSAAIEKGPSTPSNGTTSNYPIRRTHTEPSEVSAQPLEHLTKSRPRGPRRKLPKSAQGNAQPKQAAAAAVTAATTNGKNFKRIASAKQKPKLNR